MSSLSSPRLDWIERLPKDRLLGEVSLWSADLGRLSDDIARIDAFTDLYHIDVADGHFSPALLFFPDLVACARRLSKKPLHVHLMTTDDILLDQIRQFADAGADLITVHAENSNADEALALISDLRLEAGLVLQLHTPVANAARYLDRISLLTLLGTRIGVKGQGLDSQAEPRLREARDMIDSIRAVLKHRVLLAADGGIREHTVPGLCSAGADTIVMGSLAFGAQDLQARMAWVQALNRNE
jgi:ribulose-phosphate 3-epimerase